MQFFVPGVPTPQGSKQAFVRGGRAVIVDAGTPNSRTRHADWRSTVTLTARIAKGNTPTLTGATSVDLTFKMPTVKSDPHRDSHLTTPDLDKLIRSVLDALTNSGIIRDDSIVCELSARKSYVRNGEMSGVVVTVYDLSSTDEQMVQRRKDDAKSLKVSLKL